MNANNVGLLLVLVLGGIPILLLSYYGAQLMLRVPKRLSPAEFPEGRRAMAAHISFGPDASAPSRVGVVDPQLPVIRLLPFQESGLPYASRSR